MKAIGVVVNEQRLAGAADDLQALPDDLAVVADRERAEALLGRVVEEEVVAAPQVGQVPLDDVPGQVPAREVLEGVDQRSPPRRRWAAPGS